VNAVSTAFSFGIIPRRKPLYNLKSNTEETVLGRINEPLLSVKEAQYRLLERFPVLPVEQSPLSMAVGRVLAEEIRSPIDLPPFTNSGMDGFAVRAADLSGAEPESPVTLPVVADVPAGRTDPVSIGPGQAARIMTGAPLPEGADTVVPVEETDQYRGGLGGGVQASVSIFRAIQRGDYVRPRGQDIAAGQRVMDPGVRLRGQDVGMLAMLGITQAPVYRCPKVAVLSTGDELTPLGEPLQPGQIYDSNTYTLLAQVEASGAEAVNLGIARDAEATIREKLDEAVRQGVDLILSSAGVSVGAFDYVRLVVEANGGLDFWRVNMRPGKPLAFGNYQGVPFAGLPGNPVSAFVGFEVFIRPALAKLSGLVHWQRKVLKVELEEGLESDGRESYLRAVVENRDGRLLARLTGHQGSGNLLSLVQANALLIVPAGVKSLPTGSQVDAWSLETSF
jgi:molybdopterin molybdotransferase